MCEFFWPLCDPVWPQLSARGSMLCRNDRNPSRAGSDFSGNARKPTKSVALTQLKCGFFQMIQRLLYGIISVFGFVNKFENWPGDIMKAFGDDRETGIVTQ